MMENNSGLSPRGRAVLIQPYKPSVAGSLIHIPDDVLGREQMVEMRGVVIEIGANCWKDEPEARAKVGERVMVSKYSGFQATGPLDNKLYRFVNDKDIFAVITEEKENG